MKTTVDLPDPLLRELKATAALRGVSMRQALTEAVRDHLDKLQSSLEEQPVGWRAVYGRASKAAVAEVDAIVEDELGRIEPESW